MKRTTSIAALSLAAALQASAVCAGGEPVFHAAESQGPAATIAFETSVCRVPADSRSEMAEMGAFEHWQGAATAPAGHRKTLVYGAMLQDVALEPVVETHADAIANTTADESQVSERRRMFLLGLAILLNINAKQ